MNPFAPSTHGMHPLILTFSRTRERRFRRYYLHHNLKYIRIAGIVATLIWVLFGFTDYLWATDEVIRTNAVYRNLVVLPFQLVAILSSYLKRFRLFLPTLFTIAILSVGVGLSLMNHANQTEDYVTVEVGYILLIVAGYTFFRLRIVHGLLIGGMVLLLNVVDNVSLGLPFTSLIYSTLVLVVTNIFGGFAGYGMEYFTRLEYLNRQRAAAEKKMDLEMANLRSVQELARTVAHEFNNPLHVIQGIYDLHIEPTLPEREEEERHRIERIPAMVEHMSELVNRIVSITRIERRDYVPGSKMLDLKRTDDRPTPPSE
ncbi:hypothetical protein KQI63_07240 [bacterium]|nr:hypothetical protein [bacterium]